MMLRAYTHKISLVMKMTSGVRERLRKIEFYIGQHGQVRNRVSIRERQGMRSAVSQTGGCEQHRFLDGVVLKR